MSGFSSDIRESPEDGQDVTGLDGTPRVVDPAPAVGDDEGTVEAALRPRRLAEFPGQPRVRDQLLGRFPEKRYAQRKLQTLHVRLSDIHWQSHLPIPAYILAYNHSTIIASHGQRRSDTIR